MLEGSSGLMTGIMNQIFTAFIVGTNLLVDVDYFQQRIQVMSEALLYILPRINCLITRLVAVIPLPKDKMSPFDKK